MLRCLAKDHEERFSSIRDLHDELIALRSRLQSGLHDPFCTIAVLPFSDLSAAADQRHFCDGVAEEIITPWRTFPAWGVASRMSSFQYRDAAGGQPRHRP